MTTHSLQFKGRDLCDAIYSGDKRYDTRKNDIDYAAGDLVRPVATDDNLNQIEHPINNCVYRITFVSDKDTGVEEGYCTFGLELAVDGNTSIVTTSIADEIFFYLLQGVCTIAIIIVFIWTIISWIPSMNTHLHTEECFDTSGAIICGKVEGEIYWTEPIIPSPIDVLSQYRETYGNNDSMN